MMPQHTPLVTSRGGQNIRNRNRSVLQEVWHCESWTAELRFVSYKKRVRGNSEWSIHHVEGPDLCSLSSFRWTRRDRNNLDLPKDPSNLTQLQPKVLKLFVCCGERKMCEFRQQGCCCCTSQHQLKTLVSWYVIFILTRFFLNLQTNTVQEAEELTG